MRERRPELIGKFGPLSRRWKGDKAGYVAKHIWIAKHYGRANHCERDHTHKAKRYEWANVSGKYRRDREDYIQLCPSCHRRMDAKNKCRKGHEYTAENTYTNNRGHRRCITCWNERRQANATTN